MLLATLTALALAGMQSADTTFPVSRGDRLEVDNHQGSITVRAWNRNEVQIRGTGGRFDVDYDGGEVTVDADMEHGPPNLRLEIMIPAWMPVELTGVNTHMTVGGTRAAVAVTTVNGNITVEGGEGNIELDTTQGTITVTGTSGRLEAVSVNQGITITGASGPVSAESVNGGIVLRSIASSDVEAETVNGGVTFSGPIRDGGHYELRTHNGNLTVGVQEGANVTVSVTTFHGDLTADFPVTVRGAREDGEFSFTLGSGSAQLDLDSFQGQIRLVRPDAIRSR